MFLCGAYEEVCGIYESLGPVWQQMGKLKFYYISALHRLGKEKKAYELLEENEGLTVEDIREGEDSIAQLWQELYENLHSVKMPVPYRYDFKAF